MRRARRRAGRSALLSIAARAACRASRSRSSPLAKPPRSGRPGTPHGPCDANASRQRIRRSGAGFTLVELLVALTLLGLLSGLVFGGFRFGVRAWERVDAHVDHASEIQWAQAFLRRRLSEAAPVRPATKQRNRPVLFEGTSTTLAFVTVLAVHGEVGGHSVLKLDLRRRDGAGALILGWAPHRFDAEDLGVQELDERVLIDGVERVEFAYFGRADPEQARPDWRDEWRDAERLPRLVRIRLEFTKASRRHWPELVVAPMVIERARRRR